LPIWWFSCSTNRSAGMIYQAPSSAVPRPGASVSQHRVTFLGGWHVVLISLEQVCLA
jgi:hypothetical protein